MFFSLVLGGFSDLMHYNNENSNCNLETYKKVTKNTSPHLIKKCDDKRNRSMSFCHISAQIIMKIIGRNFEYLEILVMFVLQKKSVS